jgi:hypothetical protein
MSIRAFAVAAAAFFIAISACDASTLKIREYTKLGAS